jgi:hypothetical protein
MARSRLLGHLYLALVLSGFAFTPRTAQALPPTIHVVGLDSDNADEQADALTSAMRSKVRSLGTYTLGEPNQQLSILMTTLKCKGAQPDATCEQSIGTQLKSKRFIWGQAVHNKAAATITVNVHLRGSDSKPTDASETYPDTSKDVQSVAMRLLGKLLGAATAGMAKVTVRSTESDCGVSIDGARAGQLTRGEGVFELAAGEHTFAVLPPCKSAQVSKTITGSEGTIDLVAPTTTAKLTTPPPEASTKESGKSSLRPIVGWSLIGVAAAGAAVGVYGWVKHTEFASGLTEIAKEPVKAGELSLSIDGSNCPAPKSTSDGRLTRFCEQNSRAVGAATLGWVATGIGGAALIGGIILLTGGKSDDKAARIQVTPLLGGVQGASFSGSF